MATSSVLNNRSLKTGSGLNDASHSIHHVTWFISLLIKIIVISSLLIAVDSINWLSLGKRGSSADVFWNQTMDCYDRSSGLTDGLITSQRRMCKRNLELMTSIVNAARSTIDFCQSLFEDSRWNCSSIRLSPNFTPDLTVGSREQAFVFALSSASLVQSVSRACSSGQTGKCDCGPMPNESPQMEFMWGGCGDDVEFGLAFSKSFTDAPWHIRGRASSKRSLTNLHNLKVGRKVAADSLVTTCKCHGVSGSCSLKTCWKALSEISVIGSRLRTSYDMAVEVKVKRNLTTNQRVLVSSSMTTRKNFTTNELVYLSISPDYCLPDRSLGSVGTVGRECEKESLTSGGCQSMCCGRGFTTRSVQVQYRCDCKYYWCCYVKCKTCYKLVEINNCR